MSFIIMADMSGDPDPWWDEENYFYLRTAPSAWSARRCRLHRLVTDDIKLAHEFHTRAEARTDGEYLASMGWRVMVLERPAFTVTRKRSRGFSSIWLAPPQR